MIDKIVEVKTNLKKINTCLIRISVSLIAKRTLQVNRKKNNNVVYDTNCSKGTCSHKVSDIDPTASRKLC